VRYILHKFKTYAWVLKMPTLRFDGARFSRTKSTPEGYLETTATVTRSGVFLYRNADGSTRRELRHPDDVFKQDSLASMKMIPITDSHPESKLVNSESAKSLQVGNVGENIVVDGRLVKVPITITDSEAVSKVKRGKNQLSLGYTADVIKEDGLYNGQPYDSRQTNIRYNHLAIVALARAGAEASIKLDGDDAIQLDDVDNDSPHGDDKGDINNNKKGNILMKKVNIDSIDYDAAPEVANAFGKLKAKVDELSAASETSKGTIDALTDEKNKMQAKIDRFDAELKKAVDKSVTERVALFDSAKEILPAETKLDEMSNLEIKKAVVLEISKDAKLDEKSEDYINARFDAAIEMNAKRVDVSEQRKIVGKKEGVSEGSKSVLLDAQERYLKTLRGEKIEEKD